MPKRALVEKRPWLLASLAAGISYFFVMKSPAIPGLMLLAWKGAGVALLAAYALARHQGQDSRMIAGVMALGALGDVTLELNLFVGVIMNGMEEAQQEHARAELAREKALGATLETELDELQRDLAGLVEQVERVRGMARESVDRRTAK